MATVGTDVYVEVLRFYAHQMSLLDSQDVEGYIDTFTENGVTHHVHHGTSLEGRTAMLEHARHALPRYRGLVARHWNDHYQMSEAEDGSLTVSYSSLVTLTEEGGRVRFESTYAVTDILERADGRFQARSRTIIRDQPISH